MAAPSSDSVPFATGAAAPSGEIKYTPPLTLRPLPEVKDRNPHLKVRPLPEVRERNPLLKVRPLPEVRDRNPFLKVRALPKVIDKNPVLKVWPSLRSETGTLS